MGSGEGYRGRTPEVPTTTLGPHPMPPAHATCLGLSLMSPLLLWLFHGNRFPKSHLLSSLLPSCLPSLSPPQAKIITNALHSWEGLFLSAVARDGLTMHIREFTSATGTGGGMRQGRKGPQSRPHHPGDRGWGPRPHQRSAATLHTEALPSSSSIAGAIKS